MTHSTAPPGTPSAVDPLSGASHTVSLLDAGRALGIGRTAAYDLARAGQFPVPVVRAGRVYRVPVAPLRRLLDGQEPKHDAGQVTA